jgi:hypothetical protein
MPGIPQVWYLDILQGKIISEATDNGGSAGLRRSIITHGTSRNNRRANKGCCKSNS